MEDECVCVCDETGRFEGHQTLEMMEGAEPEGGDPAGAPLLGVFVGAGSLFTLQRPDGVRGQGRVEAPG